MVVLALALLLLAEPRFEVRAGSGVLEGGLVELSSQRLVVDTPEGRQTLPTGQVAQITRQPPPPSQEGEPAAWVELVDGSVLLATSYEVSDGDAAIGVGDQTLTVPTRSVASVRFKEQSPEQQAEWAAILEGPRNGDLLVIRKKEALDYLAGVLESIDRDTVTFKLDDESLPVKLDKVEGLVYYHAARAALGDSFCRVSELSGSRIEVENATIVEGRLNLVSPAGLKRTVPLEQVAAIDFEVQYLSDLEPESSRWTPLVGQAQELASIQEFFRPRLNQSFDSGELRLGGKSYAKGISLHSRGELVYRLPAGKYATLSAVVGIEDRVRPAGNARLVILGDDKPLFEATVTGQDEPIEMHVDLKGVRRLAIQVDFGDDLDVSDYVNLCDARIMP